MFLFFKSRNFCVHKFLLLFYFYVVTFWFVLLPKRPSSSCIEAGQVLFRRSSNLFQVEFFVFENLDFTNFMYLSY